MTDPGRASFHARAKASRDPICAIAVICATHWEHDFVVVLFRLACELRQQLDAAAQAGRAIPRRTDTGAT